MLYFTADLFIDALVLVLHVRNDHVLHLIESLMEIYEQESRESTFVENETLTFYLFLLQEVLARRITVKDTNEIEAFFLKFKANALLRKDPEIFSSLRKVFTDTEPLSEEKYKYLLRKLGNCILWYENTRIIKRMFSNMANANGSASVEQQESVLNTISQLCEEVIRTNSQRPDELFEEEHQARKVDFDDITSITKALQVYQDTSITNVFRTGWQGLNRAFGKRGGFTLGESIVINAISHHGKALRHGTPVRVPGGWKNIEHIHPEDYVIGKNGRATRVYSVDYQGERPIYRVFFEDNRWVDCDESHLWTVYDNSDVTEMTTKEILFRMDSGRKYYVPLCNPEYNEEKLLPIHPYLIGVLIVRKFSVYDKAVQFRTTKEIARKLKKCFPAHWSVTQVDMIKNCSLILKDLTENEVNTLKDMRLWDKYSEQMHLSDDYLYCSSTQKMELVNGLLDAIGTVHPYTTENGMPSDAIQCCVSSRQIAFQLREIFWSLGAVCYLKTLGTPIPNKRKYRLTIRHPSPRTLFSTQSQLQKLSIASMFSLRPVRLRITRIEDLHIKDKATCICIEGSDSLFVTKDYVVTHNSMMLLNFARWAVTLNKVSNTFKNPTCLFYSLENETPQNLMQLFKALYCNLYQTPPPPDWTNEQIIEFCHERFRVQGWKFVLDRRLGTEFGFNELVTNFEEYVAAGYTPLICIIDYMNIMKKTSSSGDRTEGNWLQLRELYSNTVNYLKAKNCCLITAHQLNRKAAEIAQQNPAHVVKRFDISMLADGMDPQREIDCAFYAHKEVNQHGDAYMTMAIKKHRYDDSTPEAHKYFAYRFIPNIGILDDINGPDMSVGNIYADKYHGKEPKDDRVKRSVLGDAPVSVSENTAVG